MSYLFLHVPSFGIYLHIFVQILAIHQATYADRYNGQGNDGLPCF